MPTIDEAAFVAMLDERIQPALPDGLPTESAVRSPSISDHFEYVDVLALGELPRDVAVAMLVMHANHALYGFSDGLSEDAGEPWGGFVTIDGDMLRVRFGQLPRRDPDAGYLADELAPIPISSVVTG